jgi:hypothetical protein
MGSERYRCVEKIAAGKYGSEVAGMEQERRMVERVVFLKGIGVRGGKPAVL